jgi:glutamate--cysteine ligase
MSKPSQAGSKIVTNKADLVQWFHDRCTPADQLLVGVEHEKPPFYLNDHEPVSYQGTPGRPGLRQFFEKMVARLGWAPGFEQDKLIELQRGKINWTLEPGGQMETGGAPLRNVHQSAQETDEVIKEAVETGKSLGIGLLAAGYHPTHSGSEIPQVPKSRYQAWRSLFKEQHVTQDGANCTSAVQVNLGYQSEEDMVKMLRVALNLQPIVGALFANSPFHDGHPSGYQSYRSEVNHNYLENRYGFMLPVAFEKGFGFEKFVDYAMNMPLLGIYDGDVFVDTKGATFADFMAGKLTAFPGRKPTVSDWVNHLNTIWPEVRLRGFLEMRGADNGPPEMIKALPAFWVGLLYDKKALNAAYDMVCDWTNEDREYLRREAPRTGLQTPFLGTTLQELAKNFLVLSEAGLKRRNIRDDKGHNESIYLAPLHEIANSGRNWAQRLLDKYEGEWHGNIDKIFDEMDYAKSPSVLNPEFAAKPLPQPAAAYALKKAV